MIVSCFVRLTKIRLLLKVPSFQKMESFALLKPNRFFRPDRFLKPVRSPVSLKPVRFPKVRIIMNIEKQIL